MQARGGLLLNLLLSAAVVLPLSLYSLCKSTLMSFSVVLFTIRMSFVVVKPCT